MRWGEIWNFDCQWIGPGKFVVPTNFGLILVPFLMHSVVAL